MLHRLSILTLCILLVTGCLPRLHTRLYNYSGFTATVVQDTGDIRLENSASEDVGLVHAPGSKFDAGLMVRIHDKTYFYPTLVNHQDVSPWGTFKPVGFNSVELSLYLGRDAKLYALEPPSKARAVNIRVQPRGPVSPQILGESR